MKIDLPKIVRAIPLGEYAPELAGVQVFMWVNPPRAFLSEFFAITEGAQALEKEIADGKTEGAPEKAEAVNSAMRRWWEKAWSQGAEETRWTEAEIRQLQEHSRETDPGLWPFLMDRSWLLVKQHRDTARKN